MDWGPAIACLLIAGIATGVATPVPAGHAGALALALVSAAIGCWWRGLSRGLAVLAIGAGAAGLGAVARDRALDPPLLQWFAGSAARADPRAAEVVDLDGVLLSDAAPAEAGAARLLVAVARVRDGHGWHDTPGRVQVHVAGEMAAGHLAGWTRGRPFRAPALLRQPPAWRNFGGPGERMQQLRRGFDLTATVKSAALVTVEPAPVWHEAAARIRRHVRRTVHVSIGARDPVAAAIVIAILIGDRAGLSDEIEERLQIAGTYHVIAISGGNIALLTACCFAIARLTIRSARLRALVTIVAVGAYGWMVGSEPSVNRAVTGAAMYLALTALGLRPRGLHLVLTVGAVLSVIDPLLVVDVGAWLSFGATLAIVLVMRRVHGAIAWARPARGRSVRMLQALARSAALLFAASVGAELALLPIGAQVFGRVSLAGLVLNFIAIPAMAVVQGSGLSAIALADWRPIEEVAAGAARLAAHVLVESSRLVDTAPWLAWRVPGVAWWWIATYYAAAIPLAVRVVPASPRRVLTIVAGLALVTIATSPAALTGSSRAGLLRLVMLDVGQGDAILLQLPGGDAMLIDAGGTPGPFDIGRRLVTPALWAQGIRRITWLAVSHPDQDHVGGARAVAADLHPREIWEGVPVPANRERARLREAAAVNGIVWRAVRAGESIEAGGATIEVRHPPPPDWERQRVRNDDSIVLRVRYRDVELLLTGDAGAEFESAFETPPASIVVRVLKVAHHGSRTSSGDRFVSAYRPDIVLISAGRNNLFGHPAPDVLARFHAIGAAVFRTDEDGAISVESDGTLARVRTYRGREWTVGVLRLF